MLRPRVKPEHSPFRIGGGKIRIGGAAFGIAGELADPTGSVWVLLKAMDGSRSVEQIVEYVIERYPDESVEHVRAGVDTIMNSGYAEDAGAPILEVLTERDRERYGRGRAYFRWMDLSPRANTWEPQVALRQARVTVVGVGGTGGHAAMALAASGVGRLHCVDFDIVELSNLNRQVLFTEADIGRPKVEAAVVRLREINRDIEVTAEDLHIGGVDDVMPLAKGCDVLVLTADQPTEVRDWTNRACLSTGTPWVDAGYHGPLVTFGVYRPGQGPCYECLKLLRHRHYEALGAPPGDDAPRGPAVAQAVAAPSAGISGYLAAHGALSLITGIPPIASGHVYGVNLVAPDATFVLDESRIPDCPACGSP